MPGIFGLLRDPVTTNLLRGAKLTGRGLWKGATAGPIGRTLFGAGVGATAGFLGTDYNSSTLTVNAMMKGAMFGSVVGFGSAAATRIASKGFKASQALGRRSYMSKLVGPRLQGGEFFSYQALGAPLNKAASAEKLVGPWTAFKASPLGKFARRAGKLGTGVARKEAGRYGKIALFAFEHPVLTAGVVGGAMVAGELSGFTKDPFISPTLSGANINTKYNQQAIAAQELQTSMIAPVGAIGTAPQMLGNMHRTMMGSTQGLVQGLHRGRH